MKYCGDRYIKITYLGLNVLGKLNRDKIIYLFNTKILLYDWLNDDYLDRELIDESILIERTDYNFNPCINPKLVLPKDSNNEKNFWIVNASKISDYLNKLRSSEIKILFYLVSRLDFIKEYENELKLEKKMKKDITTFCNCSLAMLDKAIKNYLDLGILYKIKRGRYVFNFNIAFRGSYRQRILGWKALFSKLKMYSTMPNAKELINEGINKIEDLDNLFELYRKLKLSKDDKKDAVKAYRKWEEMYYETENNLESLAHKIMLKPCEKLGEIPFLPGEIPLLPNTNLKEKENNIKINLDELEEMDINTL